MKILIYAVNSIGVGHLSRTIGIANGLLEKQKDLNILFLSEVSDARFLKVNNLPYFQVPSFHSMEEDLQWNKSRPLTIKIWKKLVHTIVSLYQPDLVIYDTLVWQYVVKEVRASNKKVKEVFVLRNRKNLKEFIQNNDEIFKKISLLVFPHDQKDIRRLDIPEYLSNKLYFSGPIIRNDVSNINATNIRRRYNLSLDDFVILITNGGGNSLKKKEDTFIKNVFMALKSLESELPSSLKLIVFPGPLINKGYRSYQLNRVSSILVKDYEPNMIDLFSVSNLVICRGGYNTLHEVKAVGVPALCIPAERKSDDQQARAQALSEQNIQIRFSKNSKQDIQANLLTLLKNTPKWTYKKRKIDNFKINKNRLADKILSLLQ